MLAGALAITRAADRAVSRASRRRRSRINATYPGRLGARRSRTRSRRSSSSSMNGLDGLRYITSDQRRRTARRTITLTFDAGHQSRHRAGAGAEQAAARDAAAAAGSAAAGRHASTKSARNFLMVIGFISDDGSMTDDGPRRLRRGEHAGPDLSRVPGVGEVQLFGAQYAMRIWLDPDKLNNFELTPGDVVAAIRAQNAQVSAGQLGGAAGRAGPAAERDHHRRRRRLQTPEQFRDDPAARRTRTARRCGCGDVARVELGGENYSTRSPLQRQARRRAWRSGSPPAPTRSTPPTR